MNGEFRWIQQRCTYVLSVTHGRTDHHFEADPKLLCTDALWLQLMKEIADFMAQHGTDVNAVKLKMKDFAAIYSSETYDEIQQDRAAGSTDNGLGPVGPAGGSDSPNGAVSTPGDAEANGPGTTATFAWPGAEEAHRPGPAATDVDTAADGRSDEVAEPGGPAASDT